MLLCTVVTTGRIITVTKAQKLYLAHWIYIPLMASAAVYAVRVSPLTHSYFGTYGPFQAGLNRAGLYPTSETR